MKIQKAVNVLATLSILSFGVACNSNDRYQEGFDAGKAQGYQEGYAAGDAAGYDRAKAYFQTADYTKGFNDGKAAGITIGYNQGYTVGKNDGLAQGYTNGYNAGYSDGDKDGYDRGYDAGYDDGYDDGYDIGYDDGYGDGYDVGYDDGFADGSLSVGATPKLKGYADVLSAFHNDLIDYSKIKAPKVTKRGLVANGQLLLSEVSMTNKDTIKRQAVVEQYLVVEMAKQVKGKFGLSAERSLQVAKAANHFRKYATKRALTEEDTNAYASEIVGVSFKQVEKAFDASLKGDLSKMNNIMEKAAEKNGVSPEQMSQIVSKILL